MPTMGAHAHAASAGSVVSSARAARTRFGNQRTTSPASAPQRRRLIARRLLRGGNGVVTAALDTATPAPSAPPPPPPQSLPNGVGENTFMQSIARQGNGETDGVTLDDLLAKETGGPPRFFSPLTPSATRCAGAGGSGANPLPLMLYVPGLVGLYKLLAWNP